jgi:hypothetical protein
VFGRDALLVSRIGFCAVPGVCDERFEVVTAPIWEAAGREGGPIQGFRELVGWRRASSLVLPNFHRQKAVVAAPVDVRDHTWLRSKPASLVARIEMSVSA